MILPIPYKTITHPVAKQQNSIMKRTDNFSKFASRKKNSAIKEEFRQEKKKFKKERSEAIEKKKLELRAAQATPGGRPHQHQVTKKQVGHLITITGHQSP